MTKQITRRDFLKGAMAGAATLATSCALGGMFALRSSAEETDSTYEIIDDGYGYLTATFPNYYPKEYLVIEDDETVQAKVTALLATLTLDEKIDMLSADGAGGTALYDSERPYRTGYWKGCARVGVPEIAMYDGPMGIRMNSGYETTRPISENGMAATFDTDAAYEYGSIYGTENVATASNNQLGSQVDLLYDLTRSRGKDMFGEDMYLAGAISAAASKAMQDNYTMSTLKHLLNDGDVDEQTLHETYMWVYRENVVNGGALSCMTGYEITNGVSACMDSYLMKDVMRGMYGYDGLFMTDWGGNYEFTTDNGVTMETPSNSYNNYENITAALESGEITEEDIDEAVGYNLTALGKSGWLGLVAISADGTAAVDENAPDVIQIPEVTIGDERAELLEKNNAIAIETSEKGAVLVKNEDNTLPLADEGSVALIGLGSTYLVAGSHGENAFGYLKQIAITPYVALSEALANADVQAYVAQDIVGEAIPAEYLYVDADATENGVVRTGSDGYGAAVDTTDANIDFVTNSTDYFNAEDGTAFEFGDSGVNYTFTTYLKAPETGTYTIKVEGIFATTISGMIEINGEEITMAAGAGEVGTGFVATSGLVTTSTGLDIPSGSDGSGGFAIDAQSFADSMGITVEEAEEQIATMFSGSGSSDSFDLEEGQTYKITVTVDATLEEDRMYLAGTKDTQVRLAWITPSQKEENYNTAVEAAASADTSVVFLHSLQDLSIEEDQLTLLNDVIANASANGHKVVVVLSCGLLPDITSFVDNVDAVLQVWQPGQGGGTVISDLLTGAYNPSGKLPATWPADYSATNATLHDDGRTAETGLMGSSTSIAMKEGIFIGYKWYDSTDQNDKVLYDFGYGLSYTDFDYSLVSVTENATGADEYGYDVVVSVTNTGDVAGSAVPQIYIESTEVENGLYSPYDVYDSWQYQDSDGDGVDDYFPVIGGVQIAPLQLAGFAHTDVIEPGESTEVTIHIGQRLFSYWDTSISDDGMYERSDGTKDKYTVITGDRTLYIAKASNDLGESFTVTLA